MGLPYGKNWKIPESDIDKMLAEASARKEKEAVVELLLLEAKEYRDKSVASALREFDQTFVRDGLPVHVVGELGLEHVYPKGSDGYCCCPSGTRARSLRFRMEEAVCGTGDVACKHQTRVFWEERLARFGRVQVRGLWFTSMDEIGDYARSVSSEKKAKRAA